MTTLSEKVWYGNHPLQWVLLPLSWLYSAFSALRRWYLQLYCQKKCPVPLIVVGNLSVGGVGKTPLVIALVKALQAKGITVGVVSRGYGGQCTLFPYQVQHNDAAAWVGDEPLLIAQKTNCPVVIAPKRWQAVEYLLQQHPCQIIVSDDGLQHYRMGRAIEIAVIDGTRGLGNGLCLPAGPLRETKKRLQQVDFVVVNEGQWPEAYLMSIKPNSIRRLDNDEPIAVSQLTQSFTAIAAIGNPQRFYSTLRQLALEFIPHSYPDHYQFKATDLAAFPGPIIMTEKDAVKCRSFATENMYYLPVEAEVVKTFWDALWSHQHLQGYC